MQNTRHRFIIMLSLIAGLGGMGIVVQDAFAKKCPCDIFKDGATPCVAAHSVVRALYGTYNGPLYQVKRQSDNKTMDIGVLSPGGYANAAAQDTFLKGTTGTVSKIYDQSEKKNDLTVSQWGSAAQYILKEVPATRGKDTVSRHIIYSLNSKPGEGYRLNKTNGVATGNQPEGMYIVANGKHVSSGCCWDYGNAEADANAGNARTGSMEAIFFGTSCWFSPCSGSGPWVFADLEWGLFQASDQNGTTNKSVPYRFVSGFLKGDVRTYTIRANDATKDVLQLMGTTNRPSPSQLTGAIILCIGGDSAPSGEGTFYEGAMTIGRPADSTEDAVQKNIALVYSGKDTVTTGFYRTAPASPAPFSRDKFYQSNSRVLIGYHLPEAGRVHVNVFDQRGRRVAGLVNHIMPAGGHQAVWEAGSVPAGVYFWRVAIDGRDEGAGKIIIGK